jgi:hypothetical protein
MKKYIISLLLITVTIFSGCSKQSSSLYYWGNYQSQIHTYLKDESKDLQNQISSLEEILNKATSQNKLVPPGYHAHLGLLYLDNSQIDKFHEQLNKEKELYPESKEFISFLLKSNNQKDVK